MPFSDFKLNKQLLNALADQGLEEPTAIQQQAISPLLGGQDLLGIAPTGTGKTLAYLLPLLMKIKKAEGQHPRALILAPTRELVLQIDEAIAGLCPYMQDIRHQALYGGLGPKTQLEAVEQGVDILISTPARVWDFYKQEALVLKKVKTLILDEADRMLDMGFLPQIHRLLEVLPRKKQSLLFSATFPPEVEKLSADFLEFPTRVEVAPQATPADTIEQWQYRVPNFRTKVELLGQLLQDEDKFRRVLVFVRTKANANNIGHYLSRKLAGQTRIIHANKGQNSRINAVKQFRAGEARMLVSTDVSARGLDIPEVSHVINFDVPLMKEDYVHRIGRTGRAFRAGESITFVAPHEEMPMEDIESLIRQKVPQLSLPKGLSPFETPKEEAQWMARQIDQQRRKRDPQFKGAFHEKKRK